MERKQVVDAVLAQQIDYIQEIEHTALELREILLLEWAIDIMYIKSMPRHSGSIYLVLLTMKDYIPSITRSCVFTYYQKLETVSVARMIQELHGIQDKIREAIHYKMQNYKATFCQVAQ